MKEKKKINLKTSKYTELIIQCFKEQERDITDADMITINELAKSHAVTEEAYKEVANLGILIENAKGDKIKNPALGIIKDNVAIHKTCCEMLLLDSKSVAKVLQKVKKDEKKASPLEKMLGLQAKKDPVLGGTNRKKHTK